MGFKAVFFLIFWLITSTLGANETCSETQCKLLIDGNDLSAEFRSKSSEHGVRMVYLHLNVGNESYNPLQSHDRFFPNRWTWAQDVGEPMLSFSYQYQVLSLGLLKNQVRTLKVVLNDEPRGCLANLTSSCKDLVISRTLLEKVTRDYNSPSHSRDVVCVSVVQRDMDWLTAWYYGNVEYRCCKKEKRESETMMQCDLPVKYNKWFMVFYHFLTFGIIFSFFYGPVVIIILPDFPKQPDTLEKGTRQNSVFNPASEIPVDDFSPNVLSYFWALINYNKTRVVGTTSKAFFVAIFYNIWKLFFAVFLALNYIFFLDFFIEFEAKHAVQENVIFYYLFDIRTNKLYCLIPFIIFFVILPRNYFDFLTTCRPVQIGNLKEELRENYDALSQLMTFNFDRFSMPTKPRKSVNRYVIYPSKILLGYLVDLRNKMKSEKNFILILLFIICFHLISTISIFFNYFVVLMFSLVHLVVIWLVLISIIVFKIIYFSPFSCLINFIKNSIKENLPQGRCKYLWVPILVPWIIYFSLATILCYRFYIRMFGFVIMGLIINAKQIIAYATFIYVFVSNISSSYRTFQNRYREVKKIIFKHYKKASSLSNVERNSKTIPEKLFWCICDDENNVLPFGLEATGMFVEIFTISSILFLALAIIVFFGEEYNTSPLISGGAVLLSGKLTGMLFKELIKPDKFHGWEKIKKSSKIKQLVEEYCIKEEEDHHISYHPEMDHPQSPQNDEMDTLELQTFEDGDKGEKEDKEESTEGEPNKKQKKSNEDPPIQNEEEEKKTRKRKRRKKTTNKVNQRY